MAVQRSVWGRPDLCGGTARRKWPHLWTVFVFFLSFFLVKLCFPHHSWFNLGICNPLSVIMEHFVAQIKNCKGCVSCSISIHCFSYRFYIVLGELDRSKQYHRHLPVHNGSKKLLLLIMISRSGWSGYTEPPGRVTCVVAVVTVRYGFICMYTGTQEQSHPPSKTLLC